MSRAHDMHDDMDHHGHDNDNDNDNDGVQRAPRPPRASARAVEYRALEVTVQDGNVNRALSMLKRKMANEGIYKEMRKRRFYEKPSEEKKRRTREADRRRKKAIRIARERGYIK